MTTENELISVLRERLEQEEKRNSKLIAEMKELREFNQELSRRNAADIGRINELLAENIRLSRLLEANT